jgi:hypothetical protein
MNPLFGFAMNRATIKRAASSSSIGRSPHDCCAGRSPPPRGIAPAGASDNRDLGKGDTRNNKRDGKAYLKPVQTVTATTAQSREATSACH